MESLINKLEKDRIDMSKIYGGGYTGRMLWGSKGNMTLSGSEYASFDSQGCCVLSFVSDTGERYSLEPIC